MLDHVFTDAIGALRDAFENALLERQAFEERFQADVLLGDMTWETSYGLPGEGSPPRIRVDITLEWPTWSQTAYRLWYIGEPFDEPPRIEIELTIRVQHLASSPDPVKLLSVLPDESPAIGSDCLARTGPTIQAHFPTDLESPEHAIEVSYEGTYEIDEDTLADGSMLDGHLGAMGGWISSMLVKVGDLAWDHLPPIEIDED